MITVDNGPEFAGKVMDDYSRFVLAHWLQRDMTSDSFIEVVQEAVDRTGMDQVPITDRTRLLSDNGPGYVSRAFRDYLGMVGIRHILAAPFHPQTNGKLERYHQTLKRDVNQLPYEMPSDLEAAIVAFVSLWASASHAFEMSSATVAVALGYSCASNCSTSAPLNFNLRGSSSKVTS